MKGSEIQKRSTVAICRGQKKLNVAFKRDINRNLSVKAFSGRLWIFKKFNHPKLGKDRISGRCQLAAFYWLATFCSFIIFFWVFGWKFVYKFEKVFQVLWSTRKTNIQRWYHLLVFSLHHDVLSLPPLAAEPLTATNVYKCSFYKCV